MKNDVVDRVLALMDEAKGHEARTPKRAVLIFYKAAADKLRDQIREHGRKCEASDLSTGVRPHYKLIGMISRARDIASYMRSYREDELRSMCESIDRCLPLLEEGFTVKDVIERIDEQYGRERRAANAAEEKYDTERETKTVEDYDRDRWDRKLGRRANR